MTLRLAPTPQIRARSIRIVVAALAVLAMVVSANARGLAHNPLDMIEALQEHGGTGSQARNHGHSHDLPAPGWERLHLKLGHLHDTLDHDHNVGGVVPGQTELIDLLTGPQRPTGPDHLSGRYPDYLDKPPIFLGFV
ncbi:MAG: hypothetical protein NXI16_12020 [Alphaproteobacteria bacterium]|nr:hypothetical protein [Alphaproteobacteria bacterium]